jgi:hypothetical protein
MARTHARVDQIARYTLGVSQSRSHRSRLHRFVSAGVAVAAFAASCVPVSARTIADPREGSSPDIHYAKLVKVAAGHLRWTTITYGTWTPKKVISRLAPVKLYLDTTGSKATDYVVNITQQTYPVTVVICEVDKPNGSFVHGAHFDHPNGKTALCSFRTGNLKITKGIRWRMLWVHTPFDVDAAPDTGWVLGVRAG